ncbi:MAG: hypothetical protein ABSF77_02600 [Spirochaetia bacterium]|jgi:hypothetical protein
MIEYRVIIYHSFSAVKKKSAPEKHHSLLSVMNTLIIRSGRWDDGVFPIARAAVGTRGTAALPLSVRAAHEYDEQRGHADGHLRQNARSPELRGILLHLIKTGVAPHGLQNARPSGSTIAPG